eukprot:356036-Prorocentrum_minimum.AAC.1
MFTCTRVVLSPHSVLVEHRWPATQLTTDTITLRPADGGSVDDFIAAFRAVSYENPGPRIDNNLVTVVFE